VQFNPTPNLTQIELPNQEECFTCYILKNKKKKCCKKYKKKGKGHCKKCPVQA